jgi:hypothetical protein
MFLLMTSDSKLYEVTSTRGAVDVGTGVTAILPYFTVLELEKPSLIKLVETHVVAIGFLARTVT